MKSDVEISNLNKVTNAVKSALVHNDYKYKVDLTRYNLTKIFGLADFEEQVGPNHEDNQFGMLHDFFPIYDKDGNRGYMC